jgi:hypothetical protein
VTVVNEDDEPVAGAAVHWSVEEGQLSSPSSTTDRHGRAQVQWRLGTTEGTQRAHAVVGELEPAAFSAIAESPDAFPFDEVHPLDLPTYEGSRQVVHPDYAQVSVTAFGAYRQLAITPYPFGDARYENPSLFSGTRPELWTLAPGVPNPIVFPSGGYLSDPDLVYVPELEELWLYYRQVMGDNIILLVRSQNGRDWSVPTEVVRAPSHWVVSPSIVRRGADDWWMFSVNSGASGCGAGTTSVEVRRSTDGLVWDAPRQANLTQPDFFPWHIDVQWIPSRGEFWAVYNVKSPGSCTTPAVFIASSTDGIDWTVISSPVLVKGDVPRFQDIVYRGTFDYDPTTDAITFWYSGATYDAGRYVWQAAVERRRRADVFEDKLKSLDPRLFLPAPAPLTDWP